VVAAFHLAIRQEPLISAAVDVLQRSQLAGSIADGNHELSGDCPGAVSADALALQVGMIW
jgi:hypothetical protein